MQFVSPTTCFTSSSRLSVGMCALVLCLWMLRWSHLNTPVAAYVFQIRSCAKLLIDNHFAAGSWSLNESLPLQWCGLIVFSAHQRAPCVSIWNAIYVSISKRTSTLIECWSRSHKQIQVEAARIKIQSSRKNWKVESQWISCTVLVAVSGWWPAGVNVLLMFTVTKIRRVSVRVASCWKVFRFHTMSLPSSPMLHKVWSCTWTWNDQPLATSMDRGITLWIT